MKKLLLILLLLIAVSPLLFAQSPPKRILTFRPIPQKKYGSPDFVCASTNIGPIAFSIDNPGVASVSDAGVVHILATGTANITATLPATTDYPTPVSKTQQLVVNSAPLTIRAVATSMAYGDPIPVFIAKYTGFVNGETAANLSTQPSFSTTATSLSGVGKYPITASGASSADYTIAYVTDSLTVKKSALTITANNLSKVLDAVNPPLTVSYGGFKNGEDSTSLTTLPVATTAAKKMSPAGTYPITPRGAAAVNYSFSYVAGTLTVAPSSNADLTDLEATSATVSDFGGTTLTVVANENPLFVVPTTADSNATVTVNGHPVKSGHVSQGLPLISGNCSYPVVVTAQDGITTKTYTINAQYFVPIDGHLFSLSLSQGTLSPFYEYNRLNYTASVDNSVTSIAVYATPVVGSPATTISYLENGTPVDPNNVVLAEGDNRITIDVKSMYRTSHQEKIYTVVVTREAAPGATFALRRDNAVDLTSTGEPKVRQGVTPNGDGINDALHIDNITAYAENKLILMNRDGAKIFEAKNYDNITKVFDGHSSITGKQLEAGTYFYELQYSDNGLTKTKTGYIVLKY